MSRSHTALSAIGFSELVIPVLLSYYSQGLSFNLYLHLLCPFLSFSLFPRPLYFNFSKIYTDLPIHLLLSKFLTFLSTTLSLPLIAPNLLSFAFLFLFFYLVSLSISKYLTRLSQPCSLTFFVSLRCLTH